MSAASVPQHRKSHVFHASVVCISRMLGGHLGYLITFSCYGTRLHGDPRGSVDCFHNGFDTPYREHDPSSWRVARARLEEAPFSLDSERRPVVLRAIQDKCRHTGWELRAAHILPDHVHVVVLTTADPRIVLNQLKGAGTKALKANGFDPSRRHFWTPGGSRRYLWNQKDLGNAVSYVIEGQGVAMEFWIQGMEVSPPE